MEGKRRGAQTLRTVLFLCALIGAFVLGYLLAGGLKETSPPPQADPGQGLSPTRAGEKGIIWTCSMHPQIRLPEPGKCPICFMDLIPARQDDHADETRSVSLRQITLSPEARKLAEVEVQKVIRRPVSMETRMVGKVDYDETRLGYITTWMAGRIDRLYVDYTGSPVKKGQPMAFIYSPELLTAQAELIQAVKAGKELERSGLARVRDAAAQTEQAAREKLRLLGFTQEQIREVIQKGTPSDHITLHAPMGGVVIKKDVLEGMYVQTGTRIYTIADLSRVWVILEAFESDLPWVKMGQEVEFQTDAYPGETFRGTVVYVDPLVNEKTRTISLRLDVPNPGGRLKPGMLVRAVKRTRPAGTREELVIPASAPLITGKRAIVYVQVPGQEGVYEGREVVLGPRAGDSYIVREGISEGDVVVTKGNFKVDSAVQLLAKPSMMSPRGSLAEEGQDQAPKAPGIAGPGLPPALASQLSGLASAFDTLKVAVRAGELQKTKDAFKVFYDALLSLDPTSLNGDSALVWKEVTMLLRNDSMLGAEADSPEEASRLFKTLTEHYQILGARFRLDRVLELQALSASVPGEFKRKMGELLRPYLDLQESLAKDDFQTSRSAGKRFAAALEGVDASPLKGDAGRLWKETLDVLRTGIRAFTGAKDMEGLRSGFERLSVGMTGAVERLGAEGTGPLYEIYCPMAFDNKGATWLQRDENIRNPYFGAQMLECGEVRRQIKGGGA